MRAEVALVPRVSQEEAYERFQDDSAILVDVRSSDRYQEAHIPGARSIPLRERARELLNLPRDQAIILY